MVFHQGRLLDHVHLRVADLEASKTFYGAALEAVGLSVVMEGPEFFAADEPSSARTASRPRGSISRSRRGTGRPSTASTRPCSPPAAATTARRASAATTLATTRRTRSTPTGTTSRPSTTVRRSGLPNRFRSSLSEWKRLPSSFNRRSARLPRGARLGPAPRLRPTRARSRRLLPRLPRPPKDGRIRLPASGAPARLAPARAAA
jgi:hypothetical protein